MPLTWRNVDAPDFSTSLRGYQVFSDLLGNAFGGLNKSIDQFDTSQTDKVNKAIEAKALQFSDPEAYKQAVSSGALTAGFNPNRIDTSTLNFLDNRGEVLTNRANAAENQQNARVDRQYMLDNRNRTEADRALQDAAEPYLKQYDMLSMSSDPADHAKAAQMWKEIPQLQALKSSQYIAGVNQGNSLRTGALGLQNAELASNKGQHDWVNQLRDETDKKAADSVIARVSKLGSGVEDYKSLILTDPEFKNLSPAAQNMVYVGLGQASANPFLAPPTTPNTAVTGIYDTVVGNGRYGQPSQSLSSMKIGDVIDFGKNILIPQTRAAGIGRDERGLLGSSAAGAYQITQETLSRYAPKVLGSNWKEQSFTPENQDKIAEAIFNDNKDGNLQKTWASLPNRTPGAYKNVPWSQMKDIITQGESGGTASPVDINQSSVLLTNLAQKHATSGGLERLAAATDVKVDVPNAVAAALKDPTFKGASESWLRNSVNNIVAGSDGKINATQATEILKEAVKPTRGLFSPQGFIGGLDYDQKVIDQKVREFKSGRAQSNINDYNTDNRVASALDAATKNYQQLKQDYDQAVALARNNPDATAQLERKRQNMNKAAEMLAATQAAANKQFKGS